MSEKINTCKEILSSAQNRLIIGLVMIGTGVALLLLLIFVYRRSKSNLRKFAKITCPIMKVYLPYLKRKGLLKEAGKWKTI